MDVDKKTEIVNCLGYWPFCNSLGSAINLKDKCCGDQESYGAKQSICEIFLRCIPCIGNCIHMTVREWEINRVFVAIQDDDLDNFQYYRAFGVSLKYYYGDTQLATLLDECKPPKIMELIENEKKLKNDNF